MQNYHKIYDVKQQAHVLNWWDGIVYCKLLWWSNWCSDSYYFWFFIDKITRMGFIKVNHILFGCLRYVITALKDMNHNQLTHRQLEEKRNHWRCHWIVYITHQRNAIKSKCHHFYCKYGLLFLPIHLVWYFLQKLNTSIRGKLLVSAKILVTYFDFD